MRDTLFCELLRGGGLSPRRAAVLERWLDDKTPAGLTSDELYRVIRDSTRRDLVAMGCEITILKETIAELNSAARFGPIAMTLGY